MKIRKKQDEYNEIGDLYKVNIMIPHLFRGMILLNITSCDIFESIGYAKDFAVIQAKHLTKAYPALITNVLFSDNDEDNRIVIYSKHGDRTEVGFEVKIFKCKDISDTKMMYRGWIIESMDNGKYYKTYPSIDNNANGVFNSEYFPDILTAIDYLYSLLENIELTKQNMSAGDDSFKCVQDAIINLEQASSKGKRKTTPKLFS